MSDCKKCNNCAWFGHWGKKCYVQAFVEELAVEVSPDDVCKDWTFDGLGDEEREALMAMDEEGEAK